MVATDEGFEARPEVRAPVVLPELDGLVHPAVPVTEVGGEGRAEVDVEAFLGASTAGAQRRAWSDARTQYVAHGS